jgi:hypothetical protein
MVVATGEGAPKKVVAARAVARRGAANPRVSAAERLGSDYHVIGGIAAELDGCIESCRVQYIGIGRPRG